MKDNESLFTFVLSILYDFAYAYVQYFGLACYDGRG